jgi:MAF protein
MTPHLLLASQSPRRRQLIQLVGYPFSAISADVDESSVTHPEPAHNVVQTAELKAQTTATRIKSQTETTIIVAADTTVALEQQMLGKPADEAEAFRTLSALRGRTHKVHTGVVLREVRSGRMIKGVHTAVVTMRTYSDEEIAAYIATGDPLDKAGAYAIQHPQFQPVSHLEGCYLGVMGLSLCHLIELLAQFGVKRVADLSAIHQAHQGYPCPIFANWHSQREN